MIVQDKEIFVSYSRVDWEPYVEPLITLLSNHGFSYWLDQYLLRGGEDWLDKINDALENCSCLLLCVSPDSLKSKYVKLEYRYFFDKNKPLVPVICRHVDALPAELSRLQYIEYHNTQSIIGRLKAILSGEAGETDFGQASLPSKKSLITVEATASTVTGTVSDQFISDEYHILIYAKTDIWYLQPYTEQRRSIPILGVNWNSHTRDWDKIVAFLTKSSYMPPFTSRSHACPPSDIFAHPDVIDYDDCGISL